MKKNYLFTLVLVFATQFFLAQVTVTTTTTTAFSTCSGTASAPQIIAVSDPLPFNTNLTVTAPTGFEVKKVSDSNYSASLIISRNIGLFSLGPIPNTQLHIRLKSNATGSPSGNITFVRGAQTTNMAVLGTVNAVPATPSITASGSTTFCAGGSVTLTAPSSTGYVWSNGETSRSITVTTAGTYSVTVSNASGCTAASSDRVVTVNTLPAAPEISTTTPTTFCQGGNTVLTSSYATGNRWSNGATTQSTTISTAGMYSVTHTNSNGCTSPSSTATTVSVNALANTPAITTTGTATVCDGESVTLTSSESASPLSTYTWARDGQVLRGVTDRSIIMSFSGLYTVVVNNGVCNSLPSPARKITVNPRPENPIITPSGSIGLCVGGKVTLTSSSTTGNLWSTGAITPSITVSSAGTYTLTVTNSFGCTSRYEEHEEEIVIDQPVNDAKISVNTASVTVTVNQVPLRPVIIAEGSTTFCAGGSVTLTTLSETPVLWSNGSTDPAITVSQAGAYTAVTNNEGCYSQASLPKTVVVNALPTKPTITAVGSANLAPGKSVILTSSSSSTNTWSTNAKTRSIVVSRAGDYSVSVTSRGCTATSEPFTVTSGSTNTSKVSVGNSKKETSKSKITVYPNPSKGVFNIDSDENGEVSIVNILGQTVKKVKVKSGADNTVNAENLSNGVYFVRNENTNKSSKLIINK